jgi:hypothetical protein
MSLLSVVAKCDRGEKVDKPPMPALPRYSLLHKIIDLLMNGNPDLSKIA